MSLLRTFRFRVSLRQSAEGGSGRPAVGGGGGGAALGDGAFQECSGLEVSMDVQELAEGGRNDGVIRQVGRAKYSEIVLKRGMLQSGGPNASSTSGTGGTVDRALWQWLQGIVAGERPVRRYDGRVEVLSPSGEQVVAAWTFDRGLPTKIVGPQLDAQRGEIAIEALHIAHEGLRLGEI